MSDLARLLKCVVSVWLVFTLTPGGLRRPAPRNSLKSAVLLWLIVTVGSSRLAAQDAGDPLPQHALRRLGSTRFLPKSNSALVRLEFSSDGKYLASATSGEFGGTPGIQIWERETGKDLTPAGLKDVDPTGISWGPTGNRFITSHRETDRKSALCIWTVGNDDPQPLNTGEMTFAGVDWSPAGDRIAARSWDDQVILFDDKGKELHRIPFAGKTCRSSHALDFTPDGRQLAVDSRNGIQIYNVSDATLDVELKVDAKDVFGIRILPDGKTVALATGDGALLLRIDEKSPAPRKFNEKGAIDIAASRNGKWLVTGDFSGGTVVWDRVTGEIVAKGVYPTHGGIAFAPDDSEMALSSLRISFLKTGSWERLPTGDVYCGRLSNGQFVNGQLWIGEQGPAIQEWNFETGQTLRSLTRRSGRTSMLAGIDDKQLAAVGGDAEIDIFDLETGQVTATLSGHARGTTAVVCSKQQRRLISAGADGFVRGWDLDSKSQVFEDQVANPSRWTFPDELAISPNGEQFAHGNAVTTQVFVHQVNDGSRDWNVQTSKKFQATFLPVAFMPNSRQVASIVSKTDGQAEVTTRSLCLWDSESGKEQKRFSLGTDAIFAIAISPDGRFVAVAPFARDCSVQIWSLKLRKCVATLRGHFDGVPSLCFTPDSKKLITMSHDTTALVWDVEAAVQP